MGQARRLIAFFRRKEFFVRAGGTFVVIMGFASAFVGITDQHLNLWIAAAVILVVLLFSMVVNYRALTSPQVAVDDVIAPDPDAAGPSKVECPCDLATANHAKKLARDCYAGSVTIEPDNFEQLRVKNPYILACLKDNRGYFRGYFDAIPLRPSFAEALLQGVATETQITHEDVIAPQDLATCKYLFISGLAVRDPNTHLGRRNASILVWALLHYLDRFYGGSKPLTFALAATREGNELLARFKFPLRNDGAARKDGYRLYALQLTPDDISQRLRCVPDWSKLCTLSWSPGMSTVRSGRRPKRPPLPETKAWNLSDGRTARAR